MSTVNSETKFEVSSYRWVVLIFFILIAIITQMIWITFAPITTEAAQYFFGNESTISLNLILLLSMVFMIVYLPVNYFSIKGIERFGLKWGTGIGVILTGVFGFLRAIVPNYWVVFVFQILCAIGQPFVLNSFTKLAINWFPEKEKALAVSLGTVGILLGVALGMFVPGMFLSVGIGTILYILGGVALLFMVLYLIFVKDKPDSPPNAYSDKPMELGIKGTRDLFRKDFAILFILVLLGAGVFNALSTGIDLLFADMDNLHGLGEDAIGILGGVMIVGGIVGAVVLSTLSDKFRKRKIFLILAVGTSTVFAVLFYFITDFITLLVIAFFFGFMLISALPIGFTFGAEMTYPVPEETSNGWLMWSNQLSGILLIAVVMFIPSAAVKYNFIIYAGLFAIATILAFFLKDLKDYEIKE
ncbi:MAG: MFS transporter [Candidatus Heimdallarchaeaceae archaeon]